MATMKREPATVHDGSLGDSGTWSSVCSRYETPCTSVARPPTTSRSSTPATAAVAPAQLDAKYATWLAGLVEPDLVLGQIVQRQVSWLSRSGV